MSLIIIMLGNSFFTTFLSVKLSEHAPHLIVGLANSAYYGGILLGCLFIERIIRAIGHIRAFALFAVLNAMLIISHFVMVNAACTIICRFAVGICAGSFFIVIESWLLLLSDVKTRGKILSLYMIGLYSAQGAGQFLLNLIGQTSLFPILITALLSLTATIPLLIRQRPTPELVDMPHLRLFDIIQSSPLGFLGSILSGMMVSVLYGLGPVYGKVSGLSLLQISEMMGLTILGGLALQWPVGHLSDLFGRRRVLSINAAILVGITIALLFAHRFSFPLFLTMSTLFGSFLFTLYPLSISYTTDRISSANIIKITCVMLLLFGMGSILGPVIGSIPMTLFGAKGFYLYMGSLSLIILVLARFAPEHLMIRLKKVAPAKDPIPLAPDEPPTDLKE